MSELLLHPVTAQSVDSVLKRPAHALALIGPPGSGKEALALQIIRQLLKLDPEDYKRYPHLYTVEPIDEKVISIDTVRDLQRRLQLQVPGKNEYKQAALIRDAHLMTVEAQNALLKTLEEPPKNSIIVMTVAHDDALLETVKSRLRYIHIIPPEPSSVREWFEKSGYNNQEIDKCILYSGGLPGLMQSLLASDRTHPLFAATETSRAILQQKTFERLLLADSLSKDKDAALQVLFILGQMSRMALLKGAAPGDGQRWQRVLKASYEATNDINNNIQPKLALIKLMLEI